MAFLANVFENFKDLVRKRPPNAAQKWEEEGGAALHSYWLYAKPVNVVLSRDSYFLADAELVLSELESNALIISLNEHFSAVGYTFYFAYERWFLGTDKDPKIMTKAIDEVINKDVAAYLPQGEGALVWAKLQNEIQMLLFSHAVNEDREQKDLPVVNSIWFYGESQPRVLKMTT